jgi:hypothetical protein
MELTMKNPGCVLLKEADDYSPGQQIPRLSCNSKIHYRAHPPMGPILSELNPVPTSLI